LDRDILLLLAPLKLLLLNLCHSRSSLPPGPPPPRLDDKEVVVAGGGGGGDSGSSLRVISASPREDDKLSRAETMGGLPLSPRQSLPPPPLALTGEMAGEKEDGGETPPVTVMPPLRRCPMVANDNAGFCTAMI